MRLAATRSDQDSNMDNKLGGILRNDVSNSWTCKGSCCPLLAVLVGITYRSSPAVAQTSKQEWSATASSEIRIGGDEGPTDGRRTPPEAHKIH